MSWRVFWATIQGTEIVVPGLEMISLLLVMMFCLVFRMIRTGLIVAYFFAFRWGLIFFHEALPGHHPWFFRTYVILGLLLPILCAKKLWFTPDI